MVFNYISGIGVPLKNRVVRGGEGLTTLFKDKNGSESQLIKVASVDLKLQLLFRMSDGLFVGLTYCGELTENADLQLPPFSDGTVAIDLKGRFVSDRCLYLDFRNRRVCYDENRKIVFFGDCSGNCFTVRVCKNVYICVTDGGNLGGIIVELAE